MRQFALMRNYVFMRHIAFFILSVTASVNSVAQDDLYFVPTKKNVQKESRDYGMPQQTYYCGSSRSVDEYNRHGSYVQPIDSAGNDIIEFDAVTGSYPQDSAADYSCTRKMSRFEDYDWRESYWDGYRDGWSDSYSPYMPWYYDPWYYDPWYYGSWGYYGSWRYGLYHYGWHYGWYDPWYCHSYYWPHHWYGGVSVRPARGGVVGTRNHGYTAGRSYSGFSGRRTTGSTASTSRQRSVSRNNGSFSSSNRRVTTINGTTTGSRNGSFSNSSSSGGSRSGSFSGGGFSGGSRGGGFSGGSFGGGSRGGGGRR